jgi:hypothetical protein
VVIRTTPLAGFRSALSLAEIELYDAAGLRLPPASLNFTLTTAANNTINTGSRCNDGRLDTLCNHTDSDGSPMLRIGYPCTSGASSLSRVLVVNRQDCCQDRVQSFQVEFVNRAGVTDRPVYYFTEVISNYTIYTSDAGALQQQRRSETLLLLEVPPLLQCMPLRHRWHPSSSPACCLQGSFSEVQSRLVLRSVSSSANSPGASAAATKALMQHSPSHTAPPPHTH